MDRRDAIEAGARALWPHEWECLSDETKATAREDAARVLDAAGWTEPTVGYVVAIDDTDFPGAIYGGGVWRTVEEALKYVDSGERVWGLVPVLPPTITTNPIGEAMNATTTTCSCTNPDRLCDDCLYYAAEDAETQA